MTPGLRRSGDHPSDNLGAILAVADYLGRKAEREGGKLLQVFFKDGSSTEQVSIDYAIGHRKRRAEGIPVLLAKFEAALRGHLTAAQVDRILAMAADPNELDATLIRTFLNEFATL